MKMLKKTVYIMAPIITQLTTHIILQRKFPQIFKMDHITPKHKQGKLIYNIGSYRPLNNLCTIEKVIEEYIIGHLENFLHTNKIIIKNHHGGRKGHSTITALNQIINTATINYKNNQITGILITHMSKAFDTIDHFTLLTKIEYYDIRGQSLEIFTSYLSNRKQFVEIDIFRSQLKNSLNCSVIQGSKMSGLLYTLYTNEIPLQHTLMQNDIFHKLTGLQQITTNTINYCTVNFVDDSTNIISTTNSTEIQEYINKFYKLLEAVYNINKLIIITIRPSS